MKYKLSSMSLAALMTIGCNVHVSSDDTPQRRSLERRLPPHVATLDDVDSVRKDVSSLRGDVQTVRRETGDLQILTAEQGVELDQLQTQLARANLIQMVIIAVVIVGYVTMVVMLDRIERYP